MTPLPLSGRNSTLGVWLAFCVLLISLSTNSRAQTQLDICTEESLRTALQRGGHIQIDCATNIIYLTQPIIIANDTRISALATNAEVLLSGSNTTRLFIVQPGGTLTLERVALFSGRVTETNQNTGGIAETAGAGIYNDGGNVQVISSRFDSHSVIGITGAAGTAEGEDGENGGDGAGAAIFNSGGNVTVSNSTFSGNVATGGPGGRGADSRNQAGHGGSGGSAGGAAIYSQGGTLRVINSLFTNNTATASAPAAGGAATSSTAFPGRSGNAGDAVGAAIAGNPTQFVVAGCTFVHNRVRASDAIAAAAGVRNQEGAPGGNGGSAAGAALYAVTPVDVRNCTFFGNVATSGKGGNGGAGGPVSFGFNGGEGGDGGMASGGAVETSAGGTILHSTFSDNILVAGGAGTGGAAGGPLGEKGSDGSTGARLGAAVYATGATLGIANSILLHSTISTVDGTINDLGNNLASDANPLLPRSYTRESAGLRALANNGGPTPTMALQTNSPARNRASAAFCEPFDQRGTNRVAPCDIGAFEFHTPPPVAIAASLQASALVLTYPGHTNLTVQFTTNLTTTNWTRLTNTASTNLTSLVVTLPRTNIGRTTFYRIIGTNDGLYVPPAPLPPPF